METNGQKETEKISISLENLGTINKNKVRIQTEKSWIYLYFSYKTIVAFEKPYYLGHKRVVCQNEYSVTTEKLLNELEQNKNNRVDKITFERELREALNFLV